jgi:hypothetical protein
VDDAGRDPGEGPPAGEGEAAVLGPAAARVGAVALVSTDYAAMTTGQLADLVEFAYGDGAECDWELVFELARRALANEPGRPHTHG